MTPNVSPTQGGPLSEEMDDVNDNADKILTVYERDSEDDREDDTK